jgi:hypothetical protein
VSALTEDLTLAENGLLSDLHGLDGLRSVSGSFFISDNRSLPTCEAERLRNLIGLANIGQVPNIEGNNDEAVCP